MPTAEQILICIEELAKTHPNSSDVIVRDYNNKTEYKILDIKYCTIENKYMVVVEQTESKSK